MGRIKQIRVDEKKISCLNFILRKKKNFGKREMNRVLKICFKNKEGVHKMIEKKKKKCKFKFKYIMFLN